MNNQENNNTYVFDIVPSIEIQKNNIPGQGVDRIDRNSALFNNGSGGGISSQITGGIFSVPYNTQIKVTNLSTIIGDTSVIGTANQLTINKSGIYMLFSSVRWQNGAGGLRNSHILINGAIEFSDFGTLNAVNGCTSYFFKILNLIAGDIITLELYQSQASGTSLNIDYSNLGIIAQ